MYRSAALVLVATVAVLSQSALAHGGAYYPGAGHGAGYAEEGHAGARYSPGYGDRYADGDGYGHAYLQGYDAGAGYSGAGRGAYYGPKYNGPFAVPVVLADGHLADTYEVAAATRAHLAAVAYSKPIVLADGHLADTPEVAAAKVAHLTAVVHAYAGGYPHGHGYY